MENRSLANREIWISYMNDDGETIQGFFKLIEQTANYIKVQSGSNILTIPYHKINKIKERL